MTNRITLGASGLSVSPVSFGTWQLSPRFWGKQSKNDAITAMRTAFDFGINFFDTAEAYGDTYAETVVGEALADLPREEVVICTKVFNHFNPDGSRYPDLSPTYMTERVEGCLRRLRVESIDLLLLHKFDPLTPICDVVETLTTLRSAGKIRNYGVSNHSVEQLRAQRRVGDFTVVQPPYSFIRSQIETGLLPYCQAENIAVMVYSPMHMGLLSGKYTGNETFHDFRAYHPDFQGERFRIIAETVRSLHPLADKYNLSIYQLVLAATLMHPSIHVAVAGVKTPDQIKEAAGAMETFIERPDYFAIRTALQIDGPRKIKDASGTVK